MRVPQISDRIKEAPAVALRGFLAGVGQLLLITDRLRNKTGAGEDVPPARTPDTSESVPESAQAAAPPPAAPPAAPAEEVPAATASAAAPAAAEAPTARKRRNFDKTGNVRLLTEEDAEASEPVAAEAAVEVTEAASPPEAETSESETSESEAPAAEAPAAAEPAAETPAAETPAVSEPAAEAETAAAPSSPADTSPALPLANYDELSVASLRARLRNLTAAQVAELAEYEKAHAARAEVVTMFERRIAKLESGG